MTSLNQVKGKLRPLCEFLLTFKSIWQGRKTGTGKGTGSTTNHLYLSACTVPQCSDDLVVIRPGRSSGGLYSLHLLARLEARALVNYDDMRFLGDRLSSGRW